MSTAKKTSQVKTDDLKQKAPDESPIEVSTERNPSITESQAKEQPKERQRVTDTGQQSSDITSELTPDTNDDHINEEPDEPKTVFQAIGTLYGNVFTEQVKIQGSKDTVEGFFLKIAQNKHRLYIQKNCYRSWLLQMKNHPDTPLYLRVYPKYRIIPRKPPEVYFQVIAWGEENRWEEEPGQFIIRGVWQFIPQVRVPVLSIYRNKGVEDPSGKFKAAHIPVLMRRDDGSNPFKFNPKIPKENLPPRYFIQGKFRFIPPKSAWGWMEDLEAPTTEIPWYKKPVKAAPGEAEGKAAVKGKAADSEKQSGEFKPFKKPKSSPPSETDEKPQEKSKAETDAKSVDKTKGQPEAKTEAKSPKVVTETESKGTTNESPTETPKAGSKAKSQGQSEGQPQIRAVKSKKEKGKK